MQSTGPSTACAAVPPLPVVADAEPILVEVPTWEKIDAFVKTAPLFAYVTNQLDTARSLYFETRKPDASTTLGKVYQLMHQEPIIIRNPLFKSPQFEEFILLAFIAGILTDDQCATALYWKTAISHPDVDSVMHHTMEVPLFLPDGSLDPRAHDHFIAYHTKEEIQAMAEIWRSAPISEQRFLLAPLICYDKETVFDGLLKITATDAGKRFNRHTIDATTYRMLPSFALVRAVGRQLGGHVTMVARLGTSPSLRENGLRGERDVSLRSKFATTPETADGFPAPNEEFTGHDFYHIQILSAIPKEFQRACIGVADRFRALGYPKEANLLEDMEFTTFSKSTDKERLAFILRRINPNSSAISDTIYETLLDLFPSLKAQFKEMAPWRQCYGLPFSFSEELQALLITLAYQTVSAPFINEAIDLLSRDIDRHQHLHQYHKDHLSTLPIGSALHQAAQILLTLEEGIASDLQTVLRIYQAVSSHPDQPDISSKLMITARTLLVRIRSFYLNLTTTKLRDRDPDTVLTELRTLEQNRHNLLKRTTSLQTTLESQLLNLGRVPKPTEP